MRALAVVACLALLAGCTGTSASPAAAIPTEAPAAATPSPDLIGPAGEAYLAAAKAYNTATGKLKAPSTKAKLKTVKAYWAKTTKLQKAFTDAMLGLQVPPETQPTLDEMIAASTALTERYRAMSKARNWIQMIDLNAGLVAVQERAAAAATLLRHKLGLPDRPG